MGLHDSEEFLLYLPGCPIGDMEEEFFYGNMWLGEIYNSNSFMPENTYGIYNVNTSSAFLAEGESESSSKEENGVEWKKQCLDYISSQRAEDYDYNLIYINDNDIPELYVMKNSVADGSCLVSFEGEGGPIELQMYDYGLEYLERQNILCDSGGRMDEYYDAIYQIQGGKFQVLAKGDYGASDNSSIEIDEKGWPIYKYYWNEKMVTEEEYFIQKGKVIDEKSVKRGADNKIKLSELMTVIER